MLVDFFVHWCVFFPSHSSPTNITVFADCSTTFHGTDYKYVCLNTMMGRGLIVLQGTYIVYL